MNGIVGVMKRVAEQEVRQVHTTELGIVTAVFPRADENDKGNYQCSVRLKNKKLPDGKEFELRRVPVATPYMGMVCIPNVDDLVLVSFVGGEINAPVIIGRLYNDEDRPPVNKEKEFLLQHSVAEGGSIKLDSDGKIILTSKNAKNVLTVENDKISVVNDKFSLVVDVSGEKVTITSDKDIEIGANNGKLSLNGKEVEIKSSSTMNVEASGAMKLKGATIDLN